MNSDIRIRPLSTGDFAHFKALRLEALRDSPDAFSASYEENLVRPDDSRRHGHDRLRGDQASVCPGGQGKGAHI